MEPDQVQVWRVRLAAEPGPFQELHASLSADEHRKAQRFANDLHRRRYVIAHGALRAILGRCLDTAPATLTFAHGPHGKPRLSGPDADTLPRFNLSHSADLALVAVAADREVGVDLERVRDGIEALKLAQRFFAPAEADAIGSLDEHRRAGAFARLGVRKEALLKALGTGIARNLARVEVDAGAHAGGCPFHLTGGLESTGPWELRELPPPEHYAAAVAAAGHGWQLRCWDWN
jgi:4'-phosphopantetheinyl transferase